MARAKTNGDTASETVRSTAEDVIGQAGAMRDKVAEDAGELAAGVQERLKAVGVDTDVMMNAAKGQAGELQKLVADELKARPLRALGLAAAAGLIVGYLTAR